MLDAMPPADVKVKPRRRFRRLQSGVSILFGVLAVALCVLWVRSFWREYQVTAGFSKLELTIATASGVIAAGVGPGGPRLDFYSRTVSEVTKKYLADSTILGFGFCQPPYVGAFLPIWFLILGSTASGVVVLRNSLLSFSLRTLLLATTAVAVVLGMVCYAIR